ncbi:copper transport protein ATOX1 isoform X1 [Trichogramma pretiosum]|uniref:copper transport protein ATOX1 isoform X1 n=1 Tax=Trichogramma pretiosum TaxID=7493 RepID=UPI0006C9C9BA|nr:copper transport protein ATOX1 isoform X1 [Trichogramma pretiosum]
MLSFLQTYEYDVAMSCEGCSNAVNRVLGKLSGISKVDIDLAAKKVFVTTTLDHDVVLETLKKTGKTTTYVGVKN